jgi:hypothetical protein
MSRIITVKLKMLGGFERMKFQHHSPEDLKRVPLDRCKTHFTLRFIDGWERELLIMRMRA